MKILLSLSFCLLICLTCFSQKKKTTISPAQKAVDHIDSVVKNIVSDTTIEQLTQQKPGKQKTNSPAQKTYSIIAGYKNGQLVTLQKIHQGPAFFNDNSRTFYFENGEPVLFVEQYSNSSRMGSCGEISVSFYHYLHDSIAFAGLAKSVVHFYTCYGYKLQKPGTNILFAEIDAMKKELQTGQTIKMPDGFLNRYFNHSFMHANETIKERYGF